MSGNTLAKGLAGWVGSTLNAPGTGREHCFQVRPSFCIPGAGRVDLLTLRHETGNPDHLRIDLWNILPRAVADRDVDGMLRRVHAFQAWYAELIEHAATQGFSPGHRLCVRGNLAGRSICRSRFVDLLSHWGGTIFFWTWTRTAAGLEVLPGYDRAPSLKSARSQLRSLIDHVPWEDSVEPEESEANPIRATC